MCFDILIPESNGFAVVVLRTLGYDTKWIHCYGKIVEAELT